MKLKNNLLIGLFISVSLLGTIHASKPPKKDIHPINLDRSVTLTREGFFKGGKDVAQFLTLARDYVNCPRPEVTRMGEEAKIARFGTAQLFNITCNGTAYILKEIRDTKESPAKDEIERLELVRKSKRLAPYIYPQQKDKLQLIVPDKYLSYKDQRGKSHYIVLLKKSPGVTLQKLLQEFKKDPENKALHVTISKAFYDLGAAMARFYTSVEPSIDKTLTHRDFHGGNIFYDEASGQITLIDNERMAKHGLAELSDISTDLGTLFVATPFVLKWADPKFFEGFKAKEWYSIIVPSFILGFIRAYPKEQRRGIFKKLMDQTLTWNIKIHPDESRGLRSLIKEQLLILNRQLIDEGKPALHIIAGNRYLPALVHKLIFDEKTTALKTRDKDGNIPLHEAAAFGNLEAVKLLLEAGSDINAKSNKGETPLFKARYNSDGSPRYKAIISMLQQRGARA